MTKAPHPSILREQAILAGAVAWTAFVQVAPGDRRTVECGTRAEAEKIAAAAAAQLQRSIMVYGINGEGRSTLATVIRPNGDKRMTTTTTMPSKAGKGTKAKDLQAEAAKEVAAAVARPLGKRAQIDADAATGKLPPAPDFTAETHKRFRPALDEIKALIEDKDIAGLNAVKINPVSSSPKALARYRDLAVIALSARQLGF